MWDLLGVAAKARQRFSRYLCTQRLPQKPWRSVWSCNTGLPKAVPLRAASSDMAVPRVAPSALLALLLSFLSASASSSSPSSHCPPGHVPCPSHSGISVSSRSCILPGDLCDGMPDCPGGVPGFTPDELNCSKCSPGAFLCQEESRCIRREWLCDGTEDCINGEDEQHCRPSGTVTWHGQELRFDGNRMGCSGKLRWDVVMCDGVEDCEDGKDEKENCKEPYRSKHYLVFPVCHSGSLRCRKQGHSESPCLPAKKVCDGWYDCLHGEDERDCSGTTADFPSTTTPAPTTSTTTTVESDSTSARTAASTTSTDAVLVSINQALVDIGAVLTAMLDSLDRQPQLATTVEPLRTPPQTDYIQMSPPV